MARRSKHDRSVAQWLCLLSAVGLLLVGVTLVATFTNPDVELPNWMGTMSVGIFPARFGGQAIGVAERPPAPTLTGGASAKAAGAAPPGQGQGVPAKAAAATMPAAAPSTIQPQLLEDLEDAKLRCAEVCKARGYCCNNIDEGSNQRLSCAQACVLRARGLDKFHCVEHCSGNEGCFLKTNGLEFSFCASCADITDTDECRYGVPDDAPCFDGCDFDPYMRVKPTQRVTLTSFQVVPAAETEGSQEYNKTLTRMRYYKVGSAPLPPTERFLIHDGDDGGPNNIRIGWEMAGVVAQSTGRTFVLPPADRMYLLDFGPMIMKRRKGISKETTTKVEDLINLIQLQSVMPTLTWEQFSLHTGTSWAQAKKAAQQVSKDQVCQLRAYKRVTAKILFMPGHGRREGFSCGEWYARGGPKDSLRKDMTEGAWAVLTHGFVWHEDIFRIAARVVTHLGIFSYVALHARYNDFQFKQAQQPADMLFQKMKVVFRLSPVLYVASDEPHKFRAVAEKYGIKIVTLDDMLETVLSDVQALYGPERYFKVLGPVEELICTYAKVFVGSDKSSFSGHIHRMRVHAKAPERAMLKHTDKVDTVAVAETVRQWEEAGDTFAPLHVSRGDRFRL